MSTHNPDNASTHVGTGRRTGRGYFYVSCRCGWRSGECIATEAAWFQHEWHADRPSPAERTPGGDA